jgi:hypothetical protein
MMMSIKSILREELANSERMQVRYEEELASLPRGSLVKRVIKGNDYFYLVYREAGKVHSEYRGKSSPEEMAEYAEIKRKRALYRQQLSKVKKQIRFLKGTLRGNQAI